MQLGGLQLRLCQVPWLPAVPGMHSRPSPSVCLLSSHLTVRAWCTSCFLCETPSHLGCELLRALGLAQLGCEVVGWPDFADAISYRKPHSGPGEVIPRSHQNVKQGQVSDSTPVNSDSPLLFTPLVQGPLRPLSFSSCPSFPLRQPASLFELWQHRFTGQRAAELGELGAGQEEGRLPRGTSNSVPS